MSLKKEAGKRSDAIFALSLAMITLLAPTGTDLYLASMLEISSELKVSYASVQLTLTVYLMAQGAGQIFFGPIIDRYGRRVPLLTGIVVFSLASIWAGFSYSLASLLLSRFIQGLSGALLLVIGFSSVRDVAEGPRAARLFAILLTIEGLAPVFAPIAGGYLDANFGWRVVLWTSAAMGVAALFNSWLNLPESLPVEKRIPLNPHNIASNYLRIIRDKNFLLPTLALSSVFFYLFAYISGGAYLYQDVYGLSPDGFGLVFGISGCTVMAGAMASERLTRKRMVSDIAVMGVGFIIVGTVIAGVASQTVGIYGVMPGFMVALFGLGISEPTMVALSMASQKTALGFTAALMGSLHLMLSSLSTPISGWLLPQGTGRWFIFLLASCIVTLLIALAARNNLRRSGISQPKEDAPCNPE